MRCFKKSIFSALVLHALPSLVDSVEVLPTPPKNVTVLIYLINVIPFLQSLPFVGPGFDAAVWDVNKRFGEHFHISHEYLSSPNITDCSGLAANYDMVAQYYYNARKSRETLVFFLAGKLSFSKTKNENISLFFYQIFNF
jgi:hypothetical protein